MRVAACAASAHFSLSILRTAQPECVEMIDCFGQFAGSDLAI